MCFLSMARFQKQIQICQLQQVALRPAASEASVICHDRCQVLQSTRPVLPGDRSPSLCDRAYKVRRKTRLCFSQDRQMFSVSSHGMGQRAMNVCKTHTRVRKKP